MSAHAKLSASGSHRWMACPGSIRLEESCPDQSSAYAEEGTKAHALAEAILTDGELPDHDGEMWAAVTQYTDYCDNIKRVATPGALTLVEQRVDYSHLVPDGFGTSDYILIDNGVAHVADLKYGQGVRVSPRDNPQGMLYATGVDHEFGWIYDIHTYRIHICQPRLDHFESWDIPAEELRAWGESVVRPAAALALSPNAPLVPGEKQCRFCKAKAECRARHDLALAVAQAEFGDLPSPEKLTLEEVSFLLPRLPDIERWAKDLQEYALRAALAGTEVPGMKLVEGRSVRQWSDRAPDLLHGCGLADDEIYSQKLVGIGEIEKRLGKKHVVFDLATVKPQGKPVLVPDSDKRPRLEQAASAIEDFSAAQP